MILEQITEEVEKLLESSMKYRKWAEEDDDKMDYSYWDGAIGVLKQVLDFLKED
jgi:hypothetical protein